jgi:muramoyltetrapeptide carboxypeptidase
LIRPEPLKAGNAVGLIATANKISFESVKTATRVLESWGLKVKMASNLGRSWNQFAGSDEERTEALQEMIGDPDIRALICVRGGYGTNRIIDKLDFSPLYNSPKFICGFSDVTLLLWHLVSLGFEAIHSTMPVKFGLAGAEPSVESLKKLLFGEPYRFQYPGNLLNKPGMVEAPVIGGNLSIISHLIGTKSDIDISGKILFLEEIDEYLYRTDRMLYHLNRSKHFSKLSGFIAGNFTAMQDNEEPFGETIDQIINKQLEGFNFPTSFNAPIGHEPLNYALPLSRNIILDVQSTKVEVIVH